MFQKNTKLQIISGIAGTCFVFLLWKFVNPFLAATLSPGGLRLLNIAAILSLALPPLLVMMLSGDKFSDCGFTSESLFLQIGTGIGIGLGMATVLTLLPILLGLERMVYTGAGFKTPEQAIVQLFYFVFIVGLSEEFIFRGFLYSKLDLICFSDEMPVIISSTIFGLFHFSGFNFVQVLVCGLIGAFFCLCKKRIPHCTVVSLAIAHGIHDWMIRLLTTIL